MRILLSYRRCCIHGAEIWSWSEQALRHFHEHGQVGLGGRGVITLHSLP